MRPGSQLPLTFTEDKTPELDLYVSGANGEAYRYVKEILVAAPSEPPPLYLWGASGTGKSHLLQAACKETWRQKKQAIYLPLGWANALAPSVLEGLEGLDLVCLDEMEHLAGREDWELALFHLFNRLREVGKPLALAGRTAPAAAGIQLPDLRSRLEGALVFHLQELDDAGKLQALRLRAEARGFELPREVGEYLLRRLPRDMAALYALLNRLDQASLSLQRRLTIPFVRELLKSAWGSST